MDMTWGLFKRFVSEMDPLGAETLLDASIASTAQFQKPEWWDALAAQARGSGTPAASTGSASTGEPSAFRFNGAAMDPDIIAERLSASPLGAGMQA